MSHYVLSKEFTHYWAVEEFDTAEKAISKITERLRRGADIGKFRLVKDMDLDILFTLNVRELEKNGLKQYTVIER